MRILYIRGLFIICCFYFVNSFAAKQVEVDYKESVNVFEIMDHISLAATAPVVGYREYFDKQKFSGEDLTLLEEYQELVAKYRKKVDRKEDSLFVSAESLKKNPISHAFYIEKDINHALTFLKSYMKMKELKFLEKFYTHFLPRMKDLLVESALFGSAAKKLTKNLNKSKLKSTISSVIRFLGLKKVKIKVFYIWLPPGQTPYVRFVGHNILLGFNPVYTSSFSDDVVVLPAIIKGLFAIVPESTKLTLSKQFLAVCSPLKLQKRMMVIQDPLVLALGNMLYEEKSDKKKFSFSKQWTLYPWENSFSKILFQLAKESMKRRETINDGFLRSAAKECSSLIRISNLR